MGVLGLDSRTEDDAVAYLLQQLNHERTMTEVTAERVTLHGLRGHGTSPIAGSPAHHGAPALIRARAPPMRTRTVQASTTPSGFGHSGIIRDQGLACRTHFWLLPPLQVCWTSRLPLPVAPPATSMHRPESAARRVPSG